MARFRHRTEPFGVFTAHIIEHEDWGFKCTLVPEFGAHILELALAGMPVLDGYPTPAELSQNKWYKSSFLFPFANRLADGVYTWDGQSYEFPLDDSINGHGIHGFGTDKSFEFTKQELTDKRAVFRCSYTDGGDHPGYPFPFRFQVGFTVDRPNGLTIQLTCQNQGDTVIPVSLGWHPYFTLGTKIDEVEMELPGCSLIGVNARMMPTGKRYPYDDFSKPALIGATVLDNCFALDEAVKTAQVTLQNKAGRLVYSQASGEGGFRFLQIFTPFYRDSIAVEPMTSNIDAFNNGEGLIRLQPGGVWTGKLSVEYFPNL